MSVLATAYGKGQSFVIRADSYRSAEILAIVWYKRILGWQDHSKDSNGLRLSYNLEINGVNPVEGCLDYVIWMEDSIAYAEAYTSIYERDEKIQALKVGGKVIGQNLWAYHCNGQIHSM
jgi:hypothetical protein